MVRGAIGVMVLGALCLVSCDDDSPNRPADSGPWPSRPDANADGRNDRPLIDSPDALPATTCDASAFGVPDLATAPDAGAPLPYAGADACFADAPGSMLPICQRAACARIRSTCCAYTGDCCEGGQEEIVTRLSVQACAANAAGCLPGGSAVGKPRPTPAGLLPGGTATADGGFILERPLDTSRALEARVRLAMPACKACDESVAIGWLASPRISPRLVPVVGLVLSGQRQRRMLVVNGITVWEEALPPGSQDYRLVLRPSGAVELYVGDRLATVKPGTDGRRRRLYFAVYGRNAAPGFDDPGRARIEALTLLLRSCGNTAVWSDVSLPWPETRGFRAPSLAVRAEPQPAIGLAFERNHGLYFIERPSLATAAPPTPADRVALGVDVAAADPEVVWVPQLQRWAIFFTGIDPCGERWIGVTTLGKTPEPARLVLRAAEIDGEDVDGPSVVARLENRLYLSVRRRKGHDVDTVLVEMRDPLLPATPTDADAGAPDAQPTGPRAGLASDLAPPRFPIVRATLARASTEADFDADGMGTADAALVEDSLQLFFAGRQGTTSSIGFHATSTIDWGFTPKRLAVTAASQPALAAGLADPDVAVIDKQLVLLFGIGDGEGESDRMKGQIGLLVRPLTLPP